MAAAETQMPTAAVFAVNHTYHIMVYTEIPSLMWVKVGEECYYDEANGVLRSDTLVHRMIVPMEALDQQREYTIFQRPITDRKPYFSETTEPEAFTFAFRPVQGDHIRAYHIADAHNLVEEPVKAAAAYGDIDFLILNGDIPNHSGTMENCITIYKIASAITKGNIPIVFTRGNHDMRGIYAEHFVDCAPTDNGKSYYTFRLGSIWGMVLDCGEDKPDDHPEYGNTICCHAFRLRQTRFIQDVIAHADTQYLAEGITHRVIVCHVPFTIRYAGDFDIEDELYTQWVALLREHIQPDVIMNGHKHRLAICRPGGERDHRNQPCPAVIGSVIHRKEHYFGGAGYSFAPDGITVTFTDSQGEVLGEEKL